jgi:hypothetical protein
MGPQAEWPPLVVAPTRALAELASLVAAQALAAGPTLVLART